MKGSQVAALIGSAAVGLISASALLSGQALPPLSRVWLSLTLLSGASALITTLLLRDPVPDRPAYGVASSLRWGAAGVILSVAAWAITSVGIPLICAAGAITWAAVQQDQANKRPLAPHLLTGVCGVAMAVIVLLLAGKTLPLIS